jgi:hypothetical protein
MRRRTGSGHVDYSTIGNLMSSEKQGCTAWTGRIDDSHADDPATTLCIRMSQQTTRQHVLTNNQHPLHTMSVCRRDEIDFSPLERFGRQRNVGV